MMQPANYYTDDPTPDWQRTLRDAAEAVLRSAYRVSPEMFAPIRNRRSDLNLDPNLIKDWICPSCGTVLWYFVRGRARDYGA